MQIAKLTLIGLFFSWSFNVAIGQEMQPKAQEPTVNICGVKFIAASQIAKNVSAIKSEPYCNQQKDGRGLSRFVFALKGTVSEATPPESAKGSAELIIIGVRYEEPIPEGLSPQKANTLQTSSDLMNSDDLHLVPDGLMLSDGFSFPGTDGLSYVCARADRRAHSSGQAERVTVCRSTNNRLDPEQIKEMSLKILKNDINNLQM